MKTPDINQYARECLDAGWTSETFREVKLEEPVFAAAVARRMAEIESDAEWLTMEAQARLDKEWTPEKLLAEDRLNPDYRREVAAAMEEILAGQMAGSLS